MNIIEINNLSKNFKKTTAVSNVSMQVKKGEIYGFLGPNGAGKTTIMKLMLNLLKPTSGEIKLFGEPVQNNSYEMLKRIGSLIEYPVFYDTLTGHANLRIHCKYMGDYDETRIEEALLAVNLTNVGEKKVKEYSLGMKQRLGLARAIVSKPELLILDEPINGLDPIGILEIRTLLVKLSREYGITILISSHIISEIELIADTIGVIKKGHLIKEISMEQAKAESTAHISLHVNKLDKAMFLLDNNMSLVNFKAVSDSEIHIYDHGVNQGQINKMLVGHDVEVHSIQKVEGTLEDYFLALIEAGDRSV